MLKSPLAFVALLLASSASGAATCAAISARIDAKIRAAGVQHYTLTTMDMGAEAAGKVVGSCDLGTKKIIYLQSSDAPGHAPAAGASSGAPEAPARPGAVLTECRDGYVFTGGTCRKK